MKHKTENWFITGCNGHLGEELCLRIKETGRNVIGICRENRNTKKLEENKIECIHYNNLPNYLNCNDVLIHCAGKTGQYGSWKEYQSVNINLTSDLYSLASGKKVKKFVFISSVAALGYKNRKDLVLTENSTPELLKGELYGRSKLEAENKLLLQSYKSKTDLVILRPGLIYGNPQKNQKQTWLKRGIIIDPLERIPLIHIENFKNAVIKVVEANLNDRIFFVVDDEQPSRKYLNEVLLKSGIIRYKPLYIGKKDFTFIQQLSNYLP